MFKYLSLLLFLVTLSFSQFTRQTDSLALVDLYQSTDGANWTNNTNWLSSNSIDTWFGVTVSNKRVMNIDMPNNNMTGPFPSSITNLSELFRVTLDHNNLNGSLPSNIGDLKKLTYLHMGFNNFSGTIPTSIATINTLINIWLNNNSFSGSIPSELGNLTAIESLNLSKNFLRGSIPVELGNLSTLKSLQIAHNPISGSIPAELGNLSLLQTLNLANDSLSGFIPTELASLASLKTLYLDRNQLEGPIPKEFGNFSALTNLSLYTNQLSDSIPSELGNISTLTDLKLSSNNLHGSIPQSLENLSSLKSLYLANNNLSGKIPSIFQNLTALKDFRTENNSFTDSLPNSITEATSLEIIVLSGNQLSYLPNLSPLVNLDRLNIEQNQLQFEPLEQNAALSLSNYTYSPQDSVGEAQSINQSFGTALSFSVSVNGENNIYQWYQNDVSLDGENSPTLSISNLEYSDVGQYYCKITNTVVTGLTLYSKPIHVIGFDTTAPAAESLSGEAGDGQIDLSWTESSATDFEQYKIYIYQDDQVVRVDSLQNRATTQFSAASLTNYQSYEVWLTVSDTNGNVSAESNHLSLTPFDQTAPAAVSLQGSAGDSEVQLTWTENSDTDFQDYLLYQILDLDTILVETIEKQNTLSQTVQNLTNYTTYSFYIVVRDTNGNVSAESNTLALEPQDLTSPQAVTLTSANGRVGAIDLQWTASNADDFAHYLIYRENGQANSIIDTVKSKSALTYSDELALASVEYRYAIIVKDIHANKSDTSNFKSASWEEAKKPQLSISVFQNPVTLNYVDILVISDIDLKSDNTLLINNSSLSLSSVQSNILKSSYHVNESGELLISADITATNNEQSHIERSFQAALITDKSTVADLADVRISNLPNNSMVLLTESENGYSIQTTTSLQKDVCIEFDINAEFNELNTLFIAHKNNDTWRNLPTQIYPDKKIARVYTTNLGEFRFQLDPNFTGNNVVPKQFLLEQNYPNPFNPTTTILYKLARDGHFKILIFNSLGQVVRTIENSYKLAGSYQTIWNGKNDHGRAVSSGLYFYQLQTANKVISKKMLLLK